MKKFVLLILLVMFCTINFTALTYGGVDLSKWQVFGTDDGPQK
jgi:hypothetical protein